MRVRSHIVLGAVGAAFLVVAGAAAVTGGRGVSQQGTFLQSGTGATLQTIEQALRRTVDPRDFGADCNGSTDDSSPLALMAAANSTNGMVMGFSCPIKNAYGTYYPVFGTINHHDYATIGTSEQLTNTGFTGSPATGWTLANFTSANPTITHVAGTVGTASQSFTFAPSNNYLLTVTVTTTAVGNLDFQVGGVSMMDTVVAFPVLGSTAYQFGFLYSSLSSGAQTFSIVTDTAWAGTITSASFILVQQEAEMQYLTMSTGDQVLRNPMGFRFGRFNAGVIAIGDRQTAALGGSAAVWNVAIGARALASNTTGFENTCIGTFACEAQNGSRLVALGYSALKQNTTGIQNTGLGYKTANYVTTGSNNTAVGWSALFQATTGSSNTAVGNQALYDQFTDSYSTGVGHEAGLNNRGGAENTYLGALAGFLNADANVTYAYNFTTSVGAEAKAYGSDGTAVGFQARVGADGAPNTNSTAIGYQAVSAFDSCTSVGASAACSAANEIRLGTTSSYVAAQRYAPISKGDSTGTPGNATINLQMGRSTITNGTGAITITNSLVVAQSLVFAQLATADGTCTFIKSVVPGGGSFVITTNANCTGNVNVSWQVW